jgi:glycosyltransferase involved in cell wall biosynthesis
MTGSTMLTAMSHAHFASKRAPSALYVPVYAALGAAAALAFRMGENRPLSPRSGRTGMFTSTGVPQYSKIPSSIKRDSAVVIPALITTVAGREKLQETVTALSQRSLVIVVDDGSPQTLQLQDCTMVRHTCNRGPAAARNTGKALALRSGVSIVAFTDVDCLPEPGWLEQHAILQAQAPGIWAGRTLASTSDIIGEFHDRVGTLMPRRRSAAARDALYAPTCNLSLSRAIAENLHFDENFPGAAFEDVDFCLRARDQLGLAVCISAAPTVRHCFDSSLFGLLRQYFRYGRSYHLLIDRHPGYPQDLQHSVPLGAR